MIIQMTSYSRFYNFSTPGICLIAKDSQTSCKRAGRESVSDELICWQRSGEAFQGKNLKDFELHTCMNYTSESKYYTSHDT